ncbi:MAG TPA: cytochrome c biogenesis protein CcsA [Gammaproteobacteria bacterium]|nr:cytochrome c biogenesis protein CcsA [Gammaproteobacteria bacterium]
MSSLVSITAGISAALYFAACGGVLLQSRRRLPVQAQGAFTIRAAALGAAALQAYALYRLMFTAHGVDFSFFNSASLIGLEIVLITLVASLRQPVINLGLIIFPVVGASVLGMWLTPRDALLIPDAGWGLNAHIIVSLSAYSLLAIAAVQALLLAAQDYRLRHRQTERLIGILPPLEVMEQFMFQTIGAGFALLSLALFSGFLFLHNLFAQKLAEKTLLSIVAWFVFALLLWGRWRFGWRGRTATAWTVGGFVALVLAYFGSKLVLELVFGQHRLPT